MRTVLVRLLASDHSIYLSTDAGEEYIFVSWCLRVVLIRLRASGTSNYSTLLYNSMEELSSPPIFLGDLGQTF